ncbi:MAG: hypothetical protein ACTSWZ_07750 [Candidatus Heimdallarchaeaceae archaeon]
MKKRNLMTFIFLWIMGFITTLFWDIVLIIVNPFVIESWSKLGTDLIKVVVASQGVISTAVAEFPTASEAYKMFLIFEIVGGSWLTIMVIYFFYRIMLYLVPSAQVALRDKLALIIISIAIVYLINLSYDIFTGSGIRWEPFRGWVDLIRHSDVFRDWILKRSSEEINLNISFPK